MTKAELKKLLENPNDILVGVDLDGTLCEGEWWGPEHPDPTPKKEMIDFLWKIYKKGAHIIIYTARQPRYYSLTHAWLVKYEVPFHGIAMTMKPGADVYIEDKQIHPEDL